MSNGLEYHVADTGYLALAGEMKRGRDQEEKQGGKKKEKVSLDGFILDKAIK